MKLKLVLLLVLVISLIFEIGEAKRKGKGGRKKKRNRKKRMTTTAESTTEDPTSVVPTDVTQQANATLNVTQTTQVFITSSIPAKTQNKKLKQPLDGAVTTPAVIFNNTDEVHHVGSEGLSSIIDYLFEYDNSTYDYSDEEPTVPARPTTAKPLKEKKLPPCASLGIAGIMTGHMFSGNIPVSDLLKIRSSTVSAKEKVKMTNDTLIKYNLPPLKACIAKEDEETKTKATTEMAGKSTTTTVSTTTTAPTTTQAQIVNTTPKNVIQNYPTCESLGIQTIIAAHVLSGNIPFADVQKIQNSDASQSEKLRMTNETLIRNNLPPLKTCIQETEDATQNKATTKRADKLTTSVITTTSPTSTEVVHTTPKSVVQNLPTCESLGIRSILMGYLLSGNLSFFDVEKIKNSDASEKVRLSNETLIRNNLPPLKPCTEVDKTTTKAKLTSLPSSSSVSTRETLKTTTVPISKSTLSPVKTNAQTTSKLSTVVSANPKSDDCDPDRVRNTVIGYISEDKLSGSVIQPLTNPELNQAEKLTLLNEALADAGLPVIECNEDQESHEQPTLPNCELGVNVSDHGSLLALVREMEQENELPEGTSIKVAQGEMTPHELKGMVVGAAVKSGKLAPECGELDESPTPKVLGQVSRLQKLNQLQAIIKAGYLPEDTLTQLALGHITEEWLKANLSKNEDYILSQMPDKIAELVRNGDMPPEIVAEIFSGTPNKTKIGLMMIQDDKLVKKMLSDNLRAIIGEKPVPMDLKLLMISGKNETQIKEEVENDPDLLQQMMSPSSYFFYSLFKVQMNRDINAAISACVIIVLMFVMTSLGCTMTVSKIAEHAKKPKGVVIALFAQFVIMPASAFGLTQLFQLETYAAIAVLICGCCPGGNLSNMLAYALNGDMNLSILMTSCSSILGLGMMPLSLYLYSQLIVPLDSGDIVPYGKIIFNIACTVIPVGIGIAIRHYRPQWTTYVMRFGAVMLVLCTITVAVLSGIMLGDAFFLYFDTKVLACCAILPAMGYTFGYLFAFIAREDPKCRRTICVETGCQNVQLCSTVLKLAFDPILVGVLFLMPLVYMAFQTAEACLMVMMFRLYNRCRGHKKLVEEEENSEEKKKLETDSDKASSSKESAVNEETKPLTESTDKPEKNKETNNKAKDTESDIVELWPLDNTPSPGYLDSFKAAGTENYV